MAFTYIPEYSGTNAALNTDVKGVSIAEGFPAASINNAMRAMLQQEKQELATLDTAASASTVDLTASGGFTISGTTTITAFTVKAGSRRTLHFQGALTLTHNASSLILPGGANITTAAGDCLTLVATSDNNVRVTSYMPASGVGAVGGTTATSGYVLTANGSGSAPTWQATTQVGGGYSAKTGNYTIVASDNGDVVNWTTAGFSANLDPAATLGAGFTVTIINGASSGNVTIDPNSSETLDGQTTRILEPGNRVTIICTGSAWLTLKGTYTKSSTASTLSATPVSTAHGFPRKPTKIVSQLICTTIDGLWQVGDIIDLPPYDTTATAVVGKDNTNFIIAGSTSYQAGQKSGGSTFSLTAARWNMQAIAYDEY